MSITDLTDLLNNSSALADAASNFAKTVIASGLSLIGSASIVARFLPPPDQSSPLAKLHSFINKLAQNSGYAENKQ